MSLLLRRFPRYPLDAKVRIAWENASREHCVCTGRIVDISVEGMQITSPYALPVRKVIQFQFMDKYFEGSASVRSSHHHGANYRTGLEFCGGLKWTSPPAEEPAES